MNHDYLFTLQYFGRDDKIQLKTSSTLFFYKMTLTDKLELSLALFPMGFLTNQLYGGVDLPPLVIWLSEGNFNILF